MKTGARIGAMTGTAIVMAAALGWADLGAQPLPAVETGEIRADSTRRVVRFGLGVGGGGMGSGTDAVSARAALTWGQGRSGSITIRTAAAEEFDLFGPVPAEGVWDLGVLYGRQTRGRWGYVSAAAGVALVGGMRRGDRIPGTSPPCESYDVFGCLLEAMFTPVRYEEKPFLTVGIPVELEAGFTFTRVLGLSASAWANLNGERTVTGLSVGLVLGRLR